MRGLCEDASRVSQACLTHHSHYTLGVGATLGFFCSLPLYLGQNVVSGLRTFLNHPCPHHPERRTPSQKHLQQETVRIPSVDSHSSLNHLFSCGRTKMDDMFSQYLFYVWLILKLKSGQFDMVVCSFFPQVGEDTWSSRLGWTRS